METENGLFQSTGKGFFQKLHSRIDAVDSLLCVGLDPHSSELRAPASAEAAFLFCEKLIKETHSYACCYKPNSAFFEAFGSKGIAVSPPFPAGHCPDAVCPLSSELRFSSGRSNYAPIFIATLQCWISVFLDRPCTHVMQKTGGCFKGFSSQFGRFSIFVCWSSGPGTRMRRYSRRYSHHPRCQAGRYWVNG